MQKIKLDFYVIETQLKKVHFFHFKIKNFNFQIKHAKKIEIQLIATLQFNLFSHLLHVEQILMRVKKYSFLFFILVGIKKNNIIMKFYLYAMHSSNLIYFSVQ